MLTGFYPKKIIGILSKDPSCLLVQEIFSVRLYWTLIRTQDEFHQDRSIPYTKRNLLSNRGGLPRELVNLIEITTGT